MSQFLDQLKEVTESERQRDYGRPLPNFLRIAIRWNAYLSKLGITLSPVDVGLMMIDVKMARLQNTYKDDSILDIAGYASCIGRLDEHLKELDYEGVAVFDSMNNADLIRLLEEIEGGLNERTVHVNQLPDSRRERQERS